jgi:hypothetical protein
MFTIGMCRFGRSWEKHNADHPIHVVREALLGSLWPPSLPVNKGLVCFFLELKLVFCFRFQANMLAFLTLCDT